LAILGWITITQALAQDTAVVAKGSQIISDPTNQAPTYLRDVQPIFMGSWMKMKRFT